MPRCVNIFWKGGICLSPSARQWSYIHRCARVMKNVRSMVAKSKPAELWLKEREGNNQWSRELLLSTAASNDSWWLLKRHYGLVLPSRKGVDSKTTVEIMWACFHIGCLENNLTSTLPSYYQQCPIRIRVEVHLKEWFEGERLERIFQTFVPHMEDRMQESMKISRWEKG